MPSFLRQPTPWFIVTLLWYVTLFFLSSQPQLHPPGPELPYKDKIAHAAYFAIGGSLAYVALQLAFPKWSRLKISLLVILFCGVIGALDEFRQSFIPGRSGNDVGDWLADICGGFIACMIAPRVVQKLFRP